MSSIVYALPGYKIDDDVLSAFVVERRQVRDVDDLIAYVERWRALWMLAHRSKPSYVHEVDSRIAEGVYDAREAMRCIRRARQTGKPCRHADPYPVRSKKRRILKKHRKKNRDRSRLCEGMEIMLPWAALTASRLARHYGVPNGTALHQAFCDDPNHSCCF